MPDTEWFDTIEIEKGGMTMAKERRRMNDSVKSGISFGCALAMVISYTNWHSIFWAIIHGLLGWIYVIYFIIFH